MLCLQSTTLRDGLITGHSFPKGSCAQDVNIRVSKSRGVAMGIPLPRLFVVPGHRGISGAPAGPESYFVFWCWFFFFSLAV